jgi:hypothetical protein
MRLQNMVATSSRAAVRQSWTKLATSVQRLSSPTSRGSPTSVVRACPAKWAIFCADTPVSHCPVGPSPSSQPKYASLALNLPSVAAFGRSTPDRPDTGSVTSRPANRARAPGSARIRAPTRANTPVLNSVRTEPAILSNVE